MAATGIHSPHDFGYSGLLLCGAICALPTISLAQAASTESVSTSIDRLARIGLAVMHGVGNGVVPGAATLIARDGKIVHYEATGFVDNDKSRPMPKDAVFRAFSMTKPFTSVATMMLLEEGRLQLGDPISKWLPELKAMQVTVEKRDAAGTVSLELVPARREITVQDLLRHTPVWCIRGRPRLSASLTPTSRSTSNRATAA